MAVGGIHVFEGQTPCALVRAEPESAVKNFGWIDSLALEAESEGPAEVVCGAERFSLELVAPAHLDIELLGDRKPTAMAVHERFKVQARLYDPQGRELEVGKFTHFRWTAFGMLEAANDSSSGEFGFCDTCYGMHSFRALEPGKGSIEIRLGTLRGTLMVVADSG